LILYDDEDEHEFKIVITKINLYYQAIDDDGTKVIYNLSVSLAKPTVNIIKHF